MKYEKPKLDVLPSACEAVQSGMLKTSIFYDNVSQTHPLNATAPAYEADE